MKQKAGTTFDGLRAGGHDWLSTWRAMYDAEREQAENATLLGFARRDDCWVGQAGRFAQAANRSEQPDGFMRFLLPRLRSTDRVLDIGAGTGRYEPLLARQVGHVFALEPSAAMREHLEQQLSTEGVENVAVLADAWPNADVEPCDVVFAAHVLYGVGDIAPFLQKMDETATRGCYLLLAFRHPSSFISPFWEKLYGESRLPLPGALECLNALYQLGIVAQFTTVPVTNRFGYPSEDEALADLRWRLRAPDTPEYDALIRSTIDELLDRADDGTLLPRGLPNQAAVVWWEKS